MATVFVPQPPKRVAVLVERHVGYREAVLRGVWRYAIDNGWICRAAALTDDISQRVKAWRADGVIAGLWRGDLVEPLRKLGIPVVDVFTWYDNDLPRVGIDDAEVGRVAAAHLAQLNLASYAFVGEISMRFAQLRLEHFKRHLAKQDIPCHLFPGRPFSSMFDIMGTPHEIDTEMAHWLSTLPHPVGVFAANDDLALQVIDACRAANLRVPDDVAVLGVDNDELLCALAHPPLSSVNVAPERVGYAAGVMLDALLAGQPINTPQLLPPVGVVARQSTDILTIADPDLLAAVRWIRSNACKPVKINDLLEALPVSRRNLEMRFAKYLGISPHDELRRVRIEHVKDLLANTDQPMPIIARRCGFPHAERMAGVFHEVVGQTPTAYRRQFQLR